MTSGIRHSKPVPAFSAITLRVGGKSVEGWTRFAGILEDFLRRLVDTGSGSPGAHGSTHAPATGADPIATAIPSNPTGTAASEGSADTLMRSDATIKQGIVSTKGDVLGYSTVPSRVPIGTDAQVLTADSAETLGLKWADPTGGGGGALELIEAHDFASNATTFTFSGLDGDADGLYILAYRIVASSAAPTASVVIRPNGATTNQKSSVHIACSDGPVNAVVGDTTMVLASSNASAGTGDIMAGRGWLHCETGGVRTWGNEETFWRGADGFTFRFDIAGRWNETATNITSIDVVASAANGIGAGSYVRLYKLTTVASGGGGGAGSLQLVEAHDFGSAATSFTFSGLDGDVDDTYLFRFRIIVGVAATFDVTLRPNGATTNQKSERFVYSAGGNVNDNTTTMRIGDYGGVTIGDPLTGEHWLDAKTGAARQGHGHRTLFNAGLAIGYLDSTVWNETSTNITSIDFVASVANAIGAGSYVRLYKLLPT